MTTQQFRNAAIRIYAAEMGLEGACVGVTQQQLKDGYENMKISTDANLRGAAHDFLCAGPLGDPQMLLQRPDDPLVIEWKAKALDYLRKAAESGDRLAMGDLSLIYRDSDMVAADPVESLGYAIAQDQLAQRAGDNGLTGFLTIRLKEATPAQVEAANAKARQLLDRCCTK